MEAWVHVWRDGIAPELSTAGLDALRDALLSDSPLLIQGETVAPSTMPSLYGWPCEGGCAVVFAGWHGDGKEKIGEAVEYFGRVCANADKRLGWAGAVGVFYAWYDRTDRTAMRLALLPEVERELNRRTTGAAAPGVCSLPAREPVAVPF